MDNVKLDNHPPPPPPPPPQKKKKKKKKPKHKKFIETQYTVGFGPLMFYIYLNVS